MGWKGRFSVWQKEHRGRDGHTPKRGATAHRLLWHTLILTRDGTRALSDTRCVNAAQHQSARFAESMGDSTVAGTQPLVGYGTGY